MNELMTDASLSGGWVAGVRYLMSPNCDSRPDGQVPSLIVVHAISLPPDDFGGPAIDALFTNTLDADAHPYFAQIAVLRVSAHFVIRRDGAITQYVSTDDRAWHAGVSHWQGRERCNDFSIGIELEGCDSKAFRVAQYEALAQLCRTLQERYPITDVVGHSDIAPGRKTDPGPCFDWPRLHALIASY